MSSTPIDLNALRAEIAKMSPEEIQKQLLEVRTRQRVMQKKHHDPEKSKEYMRKRNARIKEMVAWAKANGVYDQILKQASAAADEKLAEQEAEEAEAAEAGV